MVDTLKGSTERNEWSSPEDRDRGDENISMILSFCLQFLPLSMVNWSRHLKKMKQMYSALIRDVGKP